MVAPSSGNLAAATAAAAESVGVCSWVARYTACSDQTVTPPRVRRRQTAHKRHTTIGNSKKSGKHQSKNRTAEGPGAAGDLDLSSIQLSEKEARALSGLTPALARRLQRELLAQLPPAAAQELRRTLSLHAPRDPAPAPDPDPAAAHDAKTENLVEEDAEATNTTPQYSTLPRLARRSRDASPPPEPGAAGSARGAARARGTPERPLLSKYLTPERALSLDDSCSSDSSSLLAEPSYLAAYGALAPRRHSMRAAPASPAAPADQPRKRVSRFLRPDFFDGPPDETLLARQKREKELETQKILREIREKKNRSLDSSPRSPTEFGDAPPLFRDEPVLARKCVSPSILLGKERSRSNTPFFPMLDNIKETALDVSQKVKDSNIGIETSERWQKTNADDTTLHRDSKLRPKSFPVKNLDQFDEQTQNGVSLAPGKDVENKDAPLTRESKLIRPKSYPTSSPSPEKVYVSRSTKKDESVRKPSLKEETPPPALDSKNDVEVSFSISLPRKTKPAASVKTESVDAIQEKEDPVKESQSTNLVLKKYVIVNKDSVDKSETKEQKVENGVSVGNGNLNGNALKEQTKEDTKVKVVTSASKKEITQKSSEADGSEKKGTIKKKIVKKVSSKSKTDVASQDADKKDGKLATEKKKVTKKVKEKESDNGAKPTVTKKKSVLQSIGHKLEKFTSSKSNSPEKVCDTKTSAVETKKESSKLNRTQREHSVPANVEPLTESNLIKRAVTITDVATLENQASAPSKTTVSKVLGLFKKFEPKEKVIKPLQKAESEIVESSTVDIKSEATEESADEKPKRPTSLLLNGLGRKTKTVKATSDSAPANSNENNETVLKKDTEPKNIRNSLKLDFSRLPRVKKIVPTDNVIEPQIMNVTSVDKESDRKDIEKNGTLESADAADTQSRSRSRSRSTVSNSEAKSDHSSETKLRDTEENSVLPPRRNPEPTTPEKEDMADRIRRKSFYLRFNEKKQRRKSNLVGPGATEYDPLAVLHGTERSHDAPSSPLSYDLSPGYSVASDLSPSTDRYRSLLTDLPSTRNNIRFDTYGLNDKVDTYRSLDRNEFRKYPSTRSYLDYDQPPSYGTVSHRYSRTKSMLDNSDGAEETTLPSLRDPLKYNRTISMYSPGNYATYRPKRTRNSAIILKESEKEPSPDNILERIRQRKNISISVTRKPDAEKETLPRSTVSPKGEGNGAECSEKTN